MIKAVIFDLDDTLISEKEYIQSGFKAVANYISKRYKIDEKSTFFELVRMSEIDTKNVFNRLLEEKEISYTQEDINKLISIYREHKPNIKFYDDVIPILKKLKKRHIKTGIITDGYKETQRLKLEVLNAYTLFDEIIITDDLGKEFWKPSPKTFEMMMGKLNVEFDEMIYVGDNPQKDFYIGSIYPITCIRICREDCVYAKDEYKENIKEKYAIKSLEEIIYKEID